MSKTENYSAFFGLLNRMNASDRDELKKTIVMEYTSGRTESLRSMTMPEYLSALKGMERVVISSAASFADDDERKEIRKKRSSALHQMQLLGVDTANWKDVNAFCLNKRLAGKVFRELDGDELDALLVKIRIIRRKGEIATVFKLNMN